jgi:hypothetical protein
MLGRVLFGMVAAPTLIEQAAHALAGAEIHGGPEARGEVMDYIVAFVAHLAQGQALYAAEVAGLAAPLRIKRT